MREDSDIAAMTARMIRALGRRAGNNPQSLSLLNDLHKTIDQALIDAVTQARANDGYSWAEIGDALGIKKQTAAERFTRKDRQ